MGKLSGLTAIITGATSGIGKATALLFAQEDAALVVTGRRKKLGQQVAEEIQQGGGQCIFVQVDHTLPGNCERTEEDWIKTMDINITAVWRVSRLVIPYMRKRGYYEHGIPAMQEEAMRRSAASLPMGRYASADEVAQAVLFPASDDASFITGHTLMVDSGKTAA